MDDITDKTTTLRVGTARAAVTMRPETLAWVRERRAPLDDVLATARVAAAQASKNTHQIVPLCHPIPVEYCGVDYGFADGRLDIDVTVKAIAKIGVEMEALTAAAAAALCVYHLVCATDSSVDIAGVHLERLEGKKPEFGERLPASPRAAVLVMSDSISAGQKTDRSGRLIVERLEGVGVEVVHYKVVPDDAEVIENVLLHYSDEQQLDLVLTTGGTGLGPRDCTPEVMARVVQKDVSGIPEAARAHGQARTPYAMLSRGRAGIRGQTLIVNLPGSTRGVAESLDALLPGLMHALPMMRGAGHEKLTRADGGDTVA